MGFSYKLIPMFMLSHGYPEHFAVFSFFTLIPGLFLFAFSTLTQQAGFLLHLSVLLIFSGVVFYLLQMKQIFNARLRKKLEPQILATVYAKIFLFIGTVSAIIIYYQKTGYSTHFVPVILLLLGFAGLYILGMMHKIVPFLHWYNKYSPKIGMEKVPLTKDMVDEKLVRISVYLWIMGIVLLCAGSLVVTPVIVRTGGFALLISTVIFLWNVLNVFRK